MTSRDLERSNSGPQYA